MYGKMYGNCKFFFHISLPFDIIPAEEADEVWNILCVFKSKNSVNVFAMSMEHHDKYIIIILLLTSVSAAKSLALVDYSMMTS